LNTQSTPEGQSIARGLLNELVALARRFGKDPEFARGGGGNISVKTDGVLYIKPSGTSLASACPTDGARPSNCCSTRSYRSGMSSIPIRRR
jgi:rhamnose utilization protein RhaD (predicted bifunctional aldolase and dehydrogenase)